MHAQQVEVLVPLKDFRRAKLRLAPRLSPDERSALAKAMAERVLAAAAPLPVSIVCDDDEVAAWARSHRANVIWTPDLGLNGAIAAAVEQADARQVSQVIVCHADLPLATDLADVGAFDGITLVPDRRDDGTNVASVPAGAGFGWHYGPGSFARHRSEAERIGLPLRILRRADLAWDVDEPDDLDVPHADRLPRPLADLLATSP